MKDLRAFEKDSKYFDLVPRVHTSKNGKWLVLSKYTLCRRVGGGRAEGRGQALHSPSSALSDIGKWSMTQSAEWQVYTWNLFLRWNPSGNWVISIFSGKTPYQNNLNNITFFFTFFKGYRCNLLSVMRPNVFSHVASMLCIQMCWYLSCELFWQCGWLFVIRCIRCSLQIQGHLTASLATVL